MQVLLEDELGRLTIRRLRPWHLILARAMAARLDRELANGASPEASVSLAARAMLLTSPGYRRGLAASLRRMVAASVDPQGRPRPLPAARSVGAARQPYVVLRQNEIARSAPELAELAGCLADPEPVPARGVALVNQLLSDGGGPLYRAGSRDDLSTVIERASQALTR
jgi:hypothetical protein